MKTKQKYLFVRIIIYFLGLVILTIHTSCSNNEYNKIAKTELKRINSSDNKIKFKLINVEIPKDKGSKIPNLKMKLIIGEIENIVTKKELIEKLEKCNFKISEKSKQFRVPTKYELDNFKQLERQSITIEELEKLELSDTIRTRINIIKNIVVEYKNLKI